MKKSPQTNSIETPESDYLYIKKSQLPSAGYGLFIAIDIFEDEIISVFEGELVNKTQLRQRIKDGLDLYFINLPDGSMLDCMNVESFARYANDAAGYARSGFKNNAYIGMDDDDRVCLIALKDIKTGSEIFCSYGKDYWKKHK